MLFHRIKAEIVSHLSYIIGYKNEAAVIDPRRDCEIYLEIARKWGARIKYIFETHRNEDYVIGSTELASLTGAKVFHGPGLAWEYGNVIQDSQQIQLGALKIKALHTPGHSPDSMSYVIHDSEAEDQAVIVFTGDTLFVGEVGRTDFLGPEMTPVMAEKMFDSLKNKLLPLGEGVVVYPAHGSGSVCGAKIRQREITTIGIERKTNPMLKLNKEEFIKQKVAESHSSPPYFKKMEEYNLKGPKILGTLPNPCALTSSEFKEAAKEVYIIDTRTPIAFGGAHIAKSYNLPLSRLSNIGWIADYDKPILLIVEDSQALDFAVRNLVRLGFDRIEGYLAGGIESWYKEGLPISKVNLIATPDLKKLIDSKQKIEILDVRRDAEWNEGHIEGATHIYLGYLEKKAAQLPRDKPIVVICKTGKRSSIGASILLREEFKKVYNCLGGIDSWKKVGFPLTGSSN